MPSRAAGGATIWTYEGAGTSGRRWLHADDEGSVIAYSDTSANPQATYAYGPFGEPSAWSGSRYRYTGQLMISEAHLYNYKARVYDPGLGRFLQTDPVGYASDINVYAYASNDPLNRTDPSGLDDCEDLCQYVDGPPAPPDPGTEVAPETVTGSRTPKSPIDTFFGSFGSTSATSGGGDGNGGKGGGTPKGTPVAEFVVTAKKKPPGDHVSSPFLVFVSSSGVGANQPPANDNFDPLARLRTMPRHLFCTQASHDCIQNGAGRKACYVGEYTCNFVNLKPRQEDVVEVVRFPDGGRVVFYPSGDVRYIPAGERGGP